MTTIRRTFRAVSTLAAAMLVATAAPAQSPATLSLELNKMERLDGACRAYLVIVNEGGVGLDSFDVDLVTFEPSGVIGSRFRVELAPVPSGRTVVKSFDFEGVDCNAIHRVLLNDVVHCAPLDRDQCLAAIELSTLSVEFFQ